MLIIRDLGVKHPTFVEFTFRLGAYVVGTAAHPENGHIALGIGQILNPISNDYMKAIAEGFLIGNSKTFPVEAARCLESTDSGAYLLRESYYSPLILDAATCIGPLDPAKYYTAYVTISADYAVELRLTEADSGVMVGMKRSSYNGVHEKAAMGFFLIPLPSTGKYDLKKLNVGELR